MSGSIYDWSLTASNNDTADGDVNWVEGQLPSTVNNSARQMMVRVAEFIDDLGAVTSTAGTSSAFTLTTKSAFTVLADGLIVSFKANASGSAGATLNVNGIGAKSLRRITSVGDAPILSTDIVSGWKYTAVYSSSANGGSGGWIVINPSAVSANTVVGTFTGLTTSGNISATGTLTVGGAATITGALTVSGGVTGVFATGTKMVFAQTSAPTGWTKDTTHNDKALRVVSGTASSGGSVAFTTAFASQTPAGSISSVTVTGDVGATTLTTAQIPAHSHTYSDTTSTAAAHTHASGTLAGTAASSGSHDHAAGDAVLAGSVAGAGMRQYTGVGTTARTSTDGAHTHTVDVNSGATASGGSHSHTFSGSTANAGSGGSHDHTLTLNSHNHTFTGTAINMAVQYVDLIIATKN
jgi:hypothetical protein